MMINRSRDTLFFLKFQHFIHNGNGFKPNFFTSNGVILEPNQLTG